MTGEPFIRNQGIEAEIKLPLFGGERGRFVGNQAQTWGTSASNSGENIVKIGGIVMKLDS